MFLVIAQLVLVVFKMDRVMEVWDNGKHINTFPICAISGTLGPKRTQGDGQAPEGIYKVALFNPNSRYLLSFKVNYPNESDKALGTRPLGGDIYFHGKCVSAGCISFTDSLIKIIYPLVKSYKKVDVLMFPVKLDMYDALFNRAKIDPRFTHLIPFWKSLLKIHLYWDTYHKIPKTFLKSGLYEIEETSYARG